MEITYLFLCGGGFGATWTAGWVTITCVGWAGYVKTKIKNNGIRSFRKDPQSNILKSAIYI